MIDSIGSSPLDLSDEKPGSVGVLRSQSFEAAAGVDGDGFQQVAEILRRASVKLCMGAAGDAGEFGIDLANAGVVGFLK
jgi:hypothetical protein